MAGINSKAEYQDFVLFLEVRNPNFFKINLI